MNSKHDMAVASTLVAGQRRPVVAILLGCYNGMPYLREQLDSIAAQSMGDWVLLASDDGSRDETIAELERFREQVGEHRVLIRQGPARGFVANFLSMACQPGFEAQYFAFCDQDDIWMRDKLERAVNILSQQEQGIPLLYCGRTELIDEAGGSVGISPLFVRPPCFENALVQSIGGGNTMLFNERARQLLLAAGADAAVASHDWWLYMLVTGAGGTVWYDPAPYIGYRQHGDNIIGCNVGWRAKWSRFVRLLGGQLQVWNGMHCVALSRIESYLSPENRRVFEKFKASRSRSGPRCLYDLLSIHIFRQTFVGNLGLYAAALLRKI